VRCVRNRWRGPHWLNSVSIAALTGQRHNAGMLSFAAWHVTCFCTVSD
jgi:hypothetical protein